MVNMKKYEINVVAKKRSFQILKDPPMCELYEKFVLVSHDDNSRNQEKDANCILRIKTALLIM